MFSILETLHICKKVEFFIFAVKHDEIGMIRFTKGFHFIFGHDRGEKLSPNKISTF